MNAWGLSWAQSWGVSWGSSEVQQVAQFALGGGGTMKSSVCHRITGVRCDLEEVFASFTRSPVPVQAEVRALAQPFVKRETHRRVEIDTSGLMQNLDAIDKLLDLYERELRENRERDEEDAEVALLYH